jgi:RNA polymerase sigma-70 factor (ECF subfamily)
MADSEIERCIETEYRRLVAVVSLVAASVGEAEEAVQEAFARAWERSQRGEHFEHVGGWVATVALNHARSGRRRRRNEQRSRARLDSQPPLDPESSTELRTIVRSAVDGLARRQRDAVVLYYFLDLDVATVASLLRVSEGTVKSALSRARQRLAVVLGDQTMEA